MAQIEQSTVVGLFTERAVAEQAVTELQNVGFRDEQITFSGHEASTGGILAGLKSVFSGKGTSDSVYDDLIGIGMPEEDARYYQKEHEAGRSVVAVTGGSRMQEAATILARYGAYGANRRATQATDYSSSENSAAQTAATNVPAGTAGQERVAETNQEQRIQLREEQLRVYKQPVQTGEVGLRKEVVSEQKTIAVPVNREEVYIERRPVDQPIAADTPIGSDQEQSIRVPVSEERVNVDKQAVVREEINLGKRQVQETQQVSDTVRREEVRIEREGDVNVQGTDVEGREG